MCLEQREDSEILQIIIQLEGCVILIDQNGILAHDGMPLYMRIKSVILIKL